ncbi:MAG: XTP/dITP diphosphatase [Candidatus Micrarchaeota archaeon]
MQEIYFATSNLHKFEEATNILKQFCPNINFIQFPFNHIEIRSDNLDDVAKEAAQSAYCEIKKPVFVDDTGFFIKYLNGFPGTYSAWVLKKLSNTLILKLMENVKNRRASFKTAIAFARPSKEVGVKIEIFTGQCNGSISLVLRGKDGFGYDSIFVPAMHNKTFAESIILKNKLSHRYKALREFANYLNRNFQ